MCTVYVTSWYFLVLKRTFLPQHIYTRLLYLYAPTDIVYNIARNERFYLRVITTYSKQSLKIISNVRRRMSEQNALLQAYKNLGERV